VSQRKSYLLRRRRGVAKDDVHRGHIARISASNRFGL
jgi:hypothetical protein